VFGFSGETRPDVAGRRSSPGRARSDEPEASVIYGITTSRAHLDRLDPKVFPLDPSEPTDTQIDWSQVSQWMQQADPTSGDALFAGRYFLGTATAAEVDDGAGFCLWAHGEAGVDAPGWIVPIQRADPVRQAAKGGAGDAFGKRDATEIGGYLDRCLAVGSLQVIGTKQILVFLEVADGTELSIEYWAAWANQLHDVMLSNEQLLARTDDGTQLLTPAILCAYAWDDATGAFLPEPNVRAVLDEYGPSGYRTYCDGLWARRLLADPTRGTRTFDWTTIGDYRQPRPVLGLPLPYMHHVPVRYLRYLDSVDVQQIPPGPARDTLSLLTIDLPEDDDHPVAASFSARPWSANPRDPDGSGDLPSQLGFDAFSPVTTAAACLKGAQVSVTRLPYPDGGREALHFPCALAARYYRGTGEHGLPLTADESAALSASGITMVACWQHATGADATKGWVKYVAGLIAPFVNHHGRNDGQTAFAYAADTIGQPPYTPVYFSVDFPVGDPTYFPWGDPYYEPLYESGDPKYVPVATPGLTTIVQYFADVRRGYRDYLATHPETPYYVGVYCNSNTAAALYRAGLVSHYWQPPWKPVFPRLNLWQVGMQGDKGVAPDNASLRACNPSGGGTGKPFWADLDVAWGDSGGFLT
jgi:Domain of unknown function (DUF1906)